MSKVLKTATTYTDFNGDVWSNAILVVENTEINWNKQILKFTVCIYKDTTAKNEGYQPLRKKFRINEDSFINRFDLDSDISTLSAQCEAYALLYLTDHRDELYGLYFE
jgi:hypothetical protein